MEYAVLGRSGIHVSRLALGTMTFGNPLDEQQCRVLVSHALDCGINFFDTANVYEGYGRTFGSSGGLGEEMLGKALSEHRQKAVLCTKFGNPVGLGPLDAGLSVRHLERQLENSLRRLRTDWIDVVLAHRGDSSLSVEEVWRVFDRWVQSGKVLCVGVSNWAAWRVSQATELATRHDWMPPCVTSPKYNMIDRFAELEQIPCAAHYGMAVVTYQPFEGGLLTGKYRRGQPAPAGSRASEKPDWVAGLNDSVFEKLDALQKLAESLQMTLPQYVMSWVLSPRRITSVVVGCRSPEQLDSVLAGVDRRLPPEHFDRIDTLFPPPKGVGTEKVLRWKKSGWCVESELAERG